MQTLSNQFNEYCLTQKHIIPTEEEIKNQKYSDGAKLSKHAELLLALFLTMQEIDMGRKTPYLQPFKGTFLKQAIEYPDLNLAKFATKLLLSNGYQATDLINCKQTPLDAIISIPERYPIIKLLIKRGAKPHLPLSTIGKENFDRAKKEISEKNSSIIS